MAGVGLLIFAVVLAVVALVLTARLRTTLVLDTESITIIKGRRRRVVPWSMIDIVRRQGPRLLLITKPEGGAGATIVNPGPGTEATFDALIAEIQRRLDADRGYRRMSLAIHPSVGDRQSAVGPSCLGNLGVVRTRVVDAFALDLGARLLLRLGVLGFADGSLDPFTHQREVRIAGSGTR